MLEEFHAELINGAWVYKRLYGWNSLTANVWLPSLIELVGYDPNRYLDWNGCYYPAMQELNISALYYMDKKGGNQFAYFKQYNASGGQQIWVACGQENSWLRTSSCENADCNWFVNLSISRFDWIVATTSLAVHPAVLYNPERPVKQTGLLYLYRQMICLFFSIPME